MAGATIANGLVAALAESQRLRECLNWFSRHKQWINDQHLALCRIPAPTFQEQRRAEWMLEQFRTMGCEAQIDRAGNVIAFANGASEAPYVALTAHLDTVMAPRAGEDIAVGPDGKLQGPGVADNGAGLAALLAVAQAVQATSALEDWPSSLVLVSNVCEEGEGNLSGMRYLCRPSGLGSRVKAFVVLDGPGTDHITSQALASRRFEITITGPGGHSWSDYGVGNPVHALSRAISMFAESNLNGDGPGPRSSFNFGTIEGGASVNSIPTMARAKVDLRSEHVERIDELGSLLTATVERALATENERATGGRVIAKIREIGFRPGGQLEETAAVLNYLRAVDAHLGIRAHPDCSSTDANIPLSMGLQAVSIGAGGQGGGAHTPSEWFHPEGRELALKRVLLTLCLLGRDPLPDGRGSVATC